MPYWPLRLPQAPQNRGLSLSKVLVLGSNSFGATHLIDDLLTGNSKVIGISRSRLKSSQFLVYRENAKYQNFSFHQIDIVNESDQLFKLIERESPEFVVDFAGQGMVAESWDDPSAWYQTNILSKVKLLEYLRQQKSIQKYIRISTPEVYGDSEKEISESSSFNPSTPYALSHATIDAHLHLLHSRYGFPSVIGRFANFYGEGQQLFRIIPKTFIKFKRGDKLQLHGGGSSKRAFIHGLDISSGIQKLVTLARVGNTYHFSTNELFSIKEVVQLIGDRLQLPWENLIENVEDRPGKDNQYFMDVSKSRNELGWSPRVNFTEGLGKVHSWIEANFDDLSASSLEYRHAQ